MGFTSKPKNIGKYKTEKPTIVITSDTLMATISKMEIKPLTKCEIEEHRIKEYQPVY